MKWKFEKEAVKFAPDVIIVHSYRHRHTTAALKVAKKIGCKIFLVTHAPFLNDGRGAIGKFAVGFYDRAFGKRMINKLFFFRASTIFSLASRVVKPAY